MTKILNKGEEKVRGEEVLELWELAASLVDGLLDNLDVVHEALGLT